MQETRQHPSMPRHRVIAQKYEREAAELDKRAQEAEGRRQPKKAEKLRAKARKNEIEAQKYRDALIKMRQIYDSATPEARRDLGRPTKND
jgi:hypothetical protein